MAEFGGLQSSSDESEEDLAEEVIRKELSEVPLGELQDLRQKVGAKKFDTALQQAKARTGGEKRRLKRENKNRPREVSSKKPVSRFREVIPANKRQREQSRDPRFDEKAGSFNEDLFKKSYSFLEEMRSEEKQLVEREARRTRNPERKTQLHHLLQQMESREAAKRKDEERRALLREHKKAERKLQKEKGKKLFFLKKSTQRQLELVQRYQELKKTGKLDKFLSKKRKRNVSRDRKRLPFKRK